MNWQESEWRIYDFETTGPDPETAHVCQVGIAQMRLGEVLYRRSVLCNPGIPIPEEATAIHGITDAMVADARPEVDLLAKVANWITKPGVVICHYNGLHYDRRIMERILGPAFVPGIPRTEIDVLTLIRSNDVGRWWKGQGRHKLTSVAERFGIGAGVAHEAAADCVTTGLVLWHLVETNSWVRGLPDGQDLTDRIEAMAADQERDFQAWLAKQPKQEV